MKTKIISLRMERQRRRALIKGRFAGGNLGWILPEDLELFAALYCKPLTKPTAEQLQILQLIETAGPLNIQQLKEETGLLVKQITPILHLLQEAFLIYEDQYDGDWERGWYRFDELFSHAELERYSRLEALKIVLQRFAYRMVWFDLGMVKSFYKLSVRDIKAAFGALEAEEILVPWGTGWLLNDDLQILMEYQPRDLQFVYALHRSDILYKANEPELKELAKELTAGLAYDHEPLRFMGRVLSGGEQQQE